MICILLILLVRGCFTLSIYSPLGVSHSHSLGGDQVTHTHPVTNEGNKVTSSSPSLESMLPVMMMMTGGSNMGLMIYLLLEQEKHSVGHSSSMESLLPFMMMSNNQMMPFMMYLILEESGHIH